MEPILVETRASSFFRQGQIAPEYLDLKYVEVFNGVGTWTLNLPKEHPQAEALRQEGSGVVITDRVTGRVVSGRTKSATLKQSAEDPRGTWTFSGVDDNVIAAATVMLPDPSEPADAQTVGYWNKSGNGETVMKLAVSENIGAAAPAAREYSWLTVAPDLARGSQSVNTSARFDVLGDVLTSIGTRAKLGWRFAQAGDNVEFDVYPVTDKSKAVRLDIRTGGLAEASMGLSSPAATRVFVLGQGTGAARTVKEITTAESLTAEGLWGLRWETVKDQRNTDDATELTQAGEEILATGGETVRSLKVVPSDAPNQTLGRDWGLGDVITVVIDGQEAKATVTQIATAVSSEGLIKTATVGDPTGFNWEAKVVSRIRDHEERVSALETRAEGASAFSAVAGILLGYAGGTRPEGTLVCDGSVYDPDAYPALYAVLGTAYGGTPAAPRLPDFRGRVPFGLLVGDAQFGARGNTGGSKTLSAGNLPKAPIKGGLSSNTTQEWRSTGGSYDVGSLPSGGLKLPISDGNTETNAIYTGSTSPTPALPPFGVANWIITTGRAVSTPEPPAVSGQVQQGVLSKVGDGNDTMAWIVTFPEPFAQPPVVLANSLGYSGSSNPPRPEGGDNAISVPETVQIWNITMTGFEVKIKRTSSTYQSSSHYYVGWRAQTL